jgi:serine phosphatase RsbU (regulator of sigma subunit)
VVGDVRGSGLPAVDDTAVVVGAFRGAAYENLSLPGAVAHNANASYWNMAQLAETDPEYDESFVIALGLDVCEEDHSVRLVNCGHPPPLLLLRDDGRVEALEVREPALPLGFGMVSENQYEVEIFGFHPGDLLLLYTDGVIEGTRPQRHVLPARRPARHLERRRRRCPCRASPHRPADARRWALGRRCRHDRDHEGVRRGQGSRSE